MDSTLSKEFQRNEEILALLKGWKVFEEEITWLKEEIEVEEAKLMKGPIFEEKLAELNFLIAKKTVLGRVLQVKDGLEEELKGNSPDGA